MQEFLSPRDVDCAVQIWSNPNHTPVRPYPSGAISSRSFKQNNLGQRLKIASRRLSRTSSSVHEHAPPGNLLLYDTMRDWQYPACDCYSTSKEFLHGSTSTYGNSLHLMVHTGASWPLREPYPGILFSYGHSISEGGLGGAMSNLASGKFRLDSQPYKQHDTNDTVVSTFCYCTRYMQLVTAHGAQGLSMLPGSTPRGFLSTTTGRRRYNFTTLPHRTRTIAMTTYGWGPWTLGREGLPVQYTSCYVLCAMPAPNLKPL